MDGAGATCGAGKRHAMMRCRCGRGVVDSATRSGACMTVVATMATRVAVLVGRGKVLGRGIVCGLLGIRGRVVARGAVMRGVACGVSYLGCAVAGGGVVRLGVGPLAGAMVGMRGVVVSRHRGPVCVGGLE